MTHPATDERSEQQPTWLIVAGREILVKLTDRSFLLGTLVSLALILGLIGIQAWVDSRTHDYRVGVVGSQATLLAEDLADRADEIDDSVSVDVVSYDNADAARVAVDDEKIDGWLRAPSEVDASEWTLVSRETVDDHLEDVVAEVVRQSVVSAHATAAGTTIDDLTDGSGLATQQLDGDADLTQLREILGFAFAFLFYLAAIMFGMTLASSVVEEKQSRIVEMIAAAVPLRQLLAGKIVGNTVLAFAQLSLYVATGLVALTFTEYGGLVSSLSVEVGWFLLFFLVGFVVLACLWAVAGSLASRNEDLQSTVTPVTMLLMAMFFGALFLDGTAQQVASFVPPMSAVLMPMRLVEGTVAWWEPVVALVLLVALGAVLVRLGERIYRRALMQTDGRLSMLAAWRLED